MPLGTDPAGSWSKLQRDAANVSAGAGGGALSSGELPHAPSTMLVATFYDIIGILLTASRVGLAMARARELPGWLAGVHARFRTPYRSVIALGLVSALLALAFDLRSLLAVASAFMVVWYLVTHQAALELSKDKRIASLLFSWYGVVGCVALVLSLPPLATAAAAGVLTALVGIRWMLRRTPRRATPA